MHQGKENFSPGDKLVGDRLVVYEHIRVAVKLALKGIAQSKG
jgi:hypothetical protein